MRSLALECMLHTVLDSDWWDFVLASVLGNDCDSECLMGLIQGSGPSQLVEKRSFQLAGDICG